MDERVNEWPMEELTNCYGLQFVGLLIRMLCLLNIREDGSVTIRITTLAIVSQLHTRIHTYTSIHTTSLV